LLESVYETILDYELLRRGRHIQRQVGVPVVWNDIKLEEGFRIDLIVDHKVVIEIKSVEAIAPVHKKQVLTYLRLSDRRLGLLINFNTELIRDGMFRIANHMPD